MLFFNEATHTYSLEDRILVSVSSIVASQFKGFNSNAIAAGIAERGTSPEYEGMSKDQIISKWNAAGRESRDAGLQLHRDIECFFEHGRLPEDVDRPEWKQFQEFVKDHPEWHIMGCELRVHNHKVAGTIDAVFATPEGVVLVDWKRCKAINYSGYGMGLHLMKHVPDCNFSKYSLQLSLYRQLIKADVVACYIVQLHPDLENYCKHKAQDYHMEAAALIF